MSTPQRVGGANASAYSITYTPVNPGSTLIITVLGYNANSVTSVTDSLGQTVYTDFAFQEISPYPGILYVGVYRLADALSGAHTITVNTPGGWNNEYVFVDEVINILGVDTSAGTIAGTNGDSTTATSGSVTPSVADDYLHAIVFANVAGVTFSAYTNGFAQGQAATTGISVATAYLVDSSSGTAIDAGATLSAANDWAALLVPYLFGVVPSVSSVNDGNPIAEGATNVAIAGNNFASGMTVTLNQGSNTVAQAVTYISATSATFDLSMEPPIGAQLAFTDATYQTNLQVTVGGQTSSGFPVTLTPPSGNLFQTLANVHPTSSWRIQTIPDLEVGDQIEASGNATGTTAAPTGLALNPDGTFEYTNGAWTNFWARAYIATDKAWTPWAEIVCTGLAQADGFD